MYEFTPLVAPRRHCTVILGFKRCAAVIIFKLFVSLIYHRVPAKYGRVISLAPSAVAGPMQGLAAIAVRLVVMKPLVLPTATTACAKRIGATASVERADMARQGGLAGVPRARQRQSFECAHIFSFAKSRISTSCTVTQTIPSHLFKATQLLRFERITALLISVS